MKVSNWRKKLASALLAGGMISPAAAARAAEVIVNLVANPGFENVDLTTRSYYNAPLIVDWTNLAVPGFAYSHDTNATGVDGYANGTLADGGLWYFTPGNGGNDSFANAIAQSIDVSTGSAATAIAGGAAKYNLSAFFSTYDSQADRGFVRADFLNQSGENVGIAQVATPLGSPLPGWFKFSATGTIPAATRTVRLAAWGEVFAGSTGSADGYTDNVFFSVVGLTADFDSDLDVDGKDMLIWQGGFGLTTGATTAQGNSNPGVDGDVDADDFSAWKQQFGGASAVAAIGQVPEPTAVALVGVGLSALAAVRRKK